MTRPRLSHVALAALLFVLSAARSARAESPSPDAAHPLDDAGLALYLFAGHSGWDARALDARLAGAGFGTFSQAPGGGGFGIRAWSDRCKCMGALELQLALDSANADGGRTMSLASGQFTLQAGRVLFAKGGFRGYAMAGLGYGVSMLSVDPGSLPARARNPLGFADGSTGVTSFALALTALVGVDYVVPLGGSVRGFNGLLFGVRAGYDVQPLVSSWTASSGSGAGSATYPVDLPSVASDGAFVHLVFGDAAVGKAR